MTAAVPASVVRARRLAGGLLLLTTAATTVGVLFGLYWFSNRPEVVGPLTSTQGTAGGATPASPSAAPSASAAPTPTPRPPPRSGGWVAQLASYEKSDRPATVSRGLDRIRRTIPTAQVIDSDDYASLNPGYYVVVETGPFASGRAALRFCLAHGRRDMDSCLGRYLSNNPDDMRFMCVLDAGAFSVGCRGP